MGPVAVVVDVERPTRDEITSLARRVIDEARGRDLPFLAAALAYYLFVSIPPIALLVFVAATAFGGELLAEYLLGRIGSLLSPSGQTRLREILTETGIGREVTVVSLAVATWGFARLVIALETAFDRIHYVTTSRDPRKQVQHAIVLLVSLVAVLVALVVHRVLEPPALPFALLLDALVVAVMLTAILALYWTFYPGYPSLESLLPGMGFAAVSWFVLQWVFGLYVRYGANNVLSGVVGGIILLVTWLYLSALVFLLGAVLNALRVGDVRESEGSEHEDSG